MTDISKNPFEVVKATDFSDAEIADYWVDLPGGETLLHQIKPTSSMPMFVLGGKGSGKTHLMRFISSALQERRSGSGSFLQQVQADGYLGIYSRCGGLNASRFAGKDQPASRWLETFAYYMELWLGQVLLEVVESLLQTYDRRKDVEALLLTRITRLCDTDHLATTETLEELRIRLRKLQHTADHAINNCAITHELDLTIHITRGRLLFGLPALLAELVPVLKEVQFLYLFDEFENLSADQQRYVNTLIREREQPCSFKIGARLYGIRTYETLSGDEENREGAEYEVLRIDDVFRAIGKNYYQFAKELVKRRLSDVVRIEESSLDKYFETRNEKELLRAETQYIREKYAGRQRPYLAKLRSRLVEGLRGNAAPGLTSEADIDEIIASLECEDLPFLEKTATFLFYKRWAKGHDLLEASREIASACKDYSEGLKSNNRIHEILKHFKRDIIAQLRRETDQRQDYLGLTNFITMSAGLPRYLLTTLKHIYKWSIFNGEKPFREGEISRRSQHAGVLEASDWFFNEARAPGREGGAIRDSMNRLGSLLRKLRFSDKPSECSLSTIAVRASNLSASARSDLANAVAWSMLLQIPRGHRDRNDMTIRDKYQVNPMLAPRWDLPIARRGSLELKPDEGDTIFSAEASVSFDEMLRKRAARMQAPYFGRKPDSAQRALFGVEDD